MLIRLDAMAGVLAAPDDSGRVRVGAGTRLRDLNPALWELGLALPNLGDIDAQTISGAIATGTHGTGADLPGIAAAVTGLRLISPDGQNHWLSIDSESQLLAAASVSLGALGVITEVEVQCVPAYLLRAIERPGRVRDILASLEELAAAHRHVEFYWFPHTDRILSKVNDVAPHEDLAPLPRWRERLDDHLLSNVLFDGINRGLTRVPALTARVNQLSARGLSARTYVDRSYRVFCTRRDVRFVESEYALPRAALAPVLRDLDRWIRRSGARIPFPVEVRLAAADDIWLSTGYQRENAYIAVHQYHRRDHTDYFAAFEEIVAQHDGRPHWGKLHSLDAARLARLYPRFGDFLALRDRLDPGRVLRNAYLRHVLGD